MKRAAVLTPTEIEICNQAREDPSLFTEYFFAPREGGSGWRFDDNFDENGAWQETVHSASQKDITVIGGFGTGKTMGIAMSACVWSTLTSDFQFLNVGPTAWQAKQMYNIIKRTSRNTRFEDLIWKAPMRPYPQVELRYRIGAVEFRSTMEFMSADKDATNILSWEGDWINIDEAGLLDNLEEVITSLGSRLRGTIRGRERLGRFSMTSNSWDNFHLWYYFDQASADPDHFLSIVVSSRHNHNVTDEQLNRMLMRIPEDERKRFIDGTRPEGRGNFFNKDAVYSCEFLHGVEFVEDQQKAGERGYKVEKLHGAGVVYYMTPPQKDRIYMVFGDPGDGAAPQRNAPVIMAWDVTDFPNLPAQLVGFYWGNGGGKIGPFVDRLLDFTSIFKPIATGIDSTGPQKNMNFLINEYALKKHYENKPMPIGLLKGIVGMDFSGSKKMAYLHAARLLVEGEMLAWPKGIVGIRSQLTNYDVERDRKIAQDIVATMSMSAHAIRMWFHVSPEEIIKRINSQTGEPADLPRRLSNRARSKRSNRAREEVYYQR